MVLDWQTGQPFLESDLEHHEKWHEMAPSRESRNKHVGFLTVNGVNSFANKPIHSHRKSSHHTPWRESEDRKRTSGQLEASVTETMSRASGFRAAGEFGRPEPPVSAAASGLAAGGPRSHRSEPRSRAKAWASPGHNSFTYRP